jgi:excisionase family DNA binding protein
MMIAQYRGRFQFSNIAMSEPSLEFLTVDDLAPWLRLKHSTLYAWAATGKIPSVNLNGTIRFIRADIERWINDHVHQTVDLDQSTSQLVTHTPPSVSRFMLKQAGTRIIQRVKNSQATRANSNTMPTHQKKKSIS